MCANVRCFLKDAIAVWPESHDLAAKSNEWLSSTSAVTCRVPDANRKDKLPLKFSPLSFWVFAGLKAAKGFKPENPPFRDNLSNRHVWPETGFQQGPGQTFGWFTVDLRGWPLILNVATLLEFLGIW